MLSGRKKILCTVILTFTAAFLAAGCGSSTGAGGDQPAEATTEIDYSKYVATTDEMIDIDKVVTEGMVPIEGKDIKDGTYEIEVASSSGMFNVEHCDLTVENGEMTAVMTMGGTGYEYVFMGSGIEAVKAGEGYIPYEETADGKNTFTVPVESLNSAIPLTSFSKRKQKWYDRSLCFRADGIPWDNFLNGVVSTVDNLGLEDGSYTAEVTLGGGTGRSELDSPTTIIVKDGACMAQVAWSSPYYDYMLVKGERYEPVNTDGNSVFEIPIEVFDYPIGVIADTTRMSQPYEIEYTLSFDSATLQKK